MAPQVYPSPLCIGRLRAIDYRMDRLKILIREKLTFVKSKSRELTRLKHQLPEAEVSKRRLQIHTEREKLAAMIGVYRDMVNQLDYIIDALENLDKEESARDT